MAPPTQLGIGLSLARGIVRSGLDADAAAYIAAVEAARGSSISGTQKNAINTFFKTGKADGWYSSLKRIYLPIWADPAANAIDMITRTSGTFPVAGGVTHDAGYVQGNGTSGYFDIGSTPSALGLTTSGGSAFALVYDQDSRTDTRYFLGQTDSINRRVYLRQFTSTAISSTMYYAAGADTANSSSDRTGIFLGVVNTTSSRYLKRRSSSGIAYTTLNTNTETTTASPTRNVFAMANNFNGTAASFSDAKMGLYGLGLGFSDSDGDKFTLALKNLWETASGLTLP